MGVVDLGGRGALVIGAGRGIGRATALALARAGAGLVVLDRHADRAEQVAAEAASMGVAASAVVADVMERATLADAIERAFVAAPDLDVLVNVTGSATWKPLLEMDDATWDRDRRVNLDQHLWTSRAVVERWRAAGRGGAICWVGSISGAFAAPSHGAYGAAKAGLASLVRTAAEEWWPLGVRVNAVVPGSVRTPRIEATLMDPARPVPSEQLARMAEPEDIAGPIAFLVSERARRITGQTLAIEAGMSTRFPWPLAGDGPGNGAGGASPLH